MNSVEGKKELKYLLDSRFAWFNTMVLEDKNMPEDDRHRIIDGDDEIIYQEYMEDSNAKLFAIGFTVAEVEELIDEN